MFQRFSILVGLGALCGALVGCDGASSENGGEGQQGQSYDDNKADKLCLMADPETGCPKGLIEVDGCCVGPDDGVCLLIEVPDCEGGTLLPVLDEKGRCTIEFKCILDDACLMADPETGCPKGLVEVGGCCVGSDDGVCPLIEVPDCEGGTLFPVLDEEERCTIAFECIPGDACLMADPETGCPKGLVEVGGCCVGPDDGVCPLIEVPDCEGGTLFPVLDEEERCTIAFECILPA